MICKNCGKEFEGKFCPHCGHDSSKPTKAETAEKRKAAAGKLKEKLKPATDFVKKHKLLVIIVAAVLVAAIIVGTTLGVVLSNDFRVGKMNQIKIGMTKAEVKEKLGEPHEDEASTWYYYSKNYKKLIDEAKKLTGDGEDTGDEDMSEEDFESALGDLDSTLKKLEELEAKAAALLHDEIRISFSDDKVTAVEMLKNISEETKDAKKEVKKAKLAVEEVLRFTTLQTPVYAIVEYTDGSYRNAPVVLKEQPNAENEGKTQVTWHDLWSDTDVTSEINVVKNTEIYKQGQLDSSTEYFIFEVDGGYALQILGTGTVSAEGSYPWSDIEVTSVTIGNGVTSIGDNAFQGYSNLTSIEIPSSVTYIGSHAFSGCSGLTSMEIPNSVTSIGGNAFDECGSLTELKMPAEIAGVYGANNVTKVVITGGTSIGDNAFQGCSNLTSIAIPDSVTYIGSHAFSGCSGLTSMEIPNSVTSIGGNAFDECGSLTELKMPAEIAGVYGANNVTKVVITGGTSIGDDAFRGCSSLTSIAIPDSVTSIGYDAFYGCSSLQSISIPFVGATKDVTSNKYFGYIFGVSSYNDNITYVPSSLKEVIITGGTSIGVNAFRACSSLTSIAIPDSVTSIGDEAFFGCSNLTSIAIPNSVTSIGYRTFYNCSSLTSIAIPNSVTSIGDNAFQGCSNLTSITIPNSVTSIGDEAFFGCSNLTSIAIPDSVTSIGYNAFSRGLQSITIPFVGATKDVTSDTHFGHIFGATSSNGNSAAVPASLTEVIITGGTSIGDSAFDGCSSLTSIAIPDSVTSIGDEAFFGCSNLTSIAIPNSVTSIGSYAFYKTGIWNNAADNSVVYADKWAVGYKGDKGTLSGALTLKADTVGIADDAFYYCRSLTSIAIPDSVTSIGDSAFSGCSSLTSIAIPNSVTSIGYRTFYNCSSLTSIAIPDSVTSIGYDVFYNCSSLQSIEYQGTKAQWNAIWKGSSWNDFTGNYTVTCTDGTLGKWA